jgi:uncharacterized protein YcfL
MNRVVVIGAIIVAVVVAILAVGILSANHQNNNYTPKTTTTYTSTSVILNTNTTTPSTTTTSTSTSTTSTNTTTNTTTKIQYNTFYFLNQTGQNYYYVFVLSYNEYKTIISNTSTHLITYLLINYTVPTFIAKVDVVGNYVFLIGYSSWPFHPSISHQYPIGIITDSRGYSYQFTYEGNWEGPSL